MASLTNPRMKAMTTEITMTIATPMSAIGISGTHYSDRLYSDKGKLLTKQYLLRTLRAGNCSRMGHHLTFVASLLKLRRDRFSAFTIFLWAYANAMKFT